jgi:dienelactone hydrolase
MKTERKGQKWIAEEFYKVHDIFAFRAMMFVEWGFKQADIQRTNARIKVPGQATKAWEKTAEQQRALAAEAEGRGHLRGAAEFYHRAALYYGPAATLIHANTERKCRLYGLLVECYERFLKCSGLPIQRVEIPFEGGVTIPGIFQPAPGAAKAPCVIVVPGMDTIKEYFPNPYNNHFHRRGIATLSIDGPGQGESNTRETWVTLDNFERAGKAALDWLAARPEVDGGHVGLYGWSMGSYWGPRVAAYDKRLKACVGAMGVYLDKDVIFNQGRPAYKENYMYMSNIHDEAAFDRMAAQMTLEPLADKIQCPTLLAMGEFDELCPLEDAFKLYRLLRCPKEIWVFEDENHVMGGRLPDFYTLVADWMADALAGKFGPGHARETWFPPR